MILDFLTYVCIIFRGQHECKFNYMSITLHHKLFLKGKVCLFIISFIFENFINLHCINIEITMH